jgi:hypothetical protein
VGEHHCSHFRLTFEKAFENDSVRELYRGVGWHEVSVILLAVYEPGGVAPDRGVVTGRASGMTFRFHLDRAG